MSSLVLAHTRYQVIEQIRVPIGLLASGLFPAIAMLAFAVPFVGDDPVGSTLSMGSMMLLGAMSAALMGLSISVAMDREQPFNPYLRTLPAGPFPDFAGRTRRPRPVWCRPAAPVILGAARLREAGRGAAGRAGMGGAALAGAVPFMLIGLFVGLMMPSKGAIAVSQILFF